MPTVVVDDMEAYIQEFVEGTSGGTLDPPVAGPIEAPADGDVLSDAEMLEIAIDNAELTPIWCAAPTLARMSLTLQVCPACQAEIYVGCDGWMRRNDNSDHNRCFFYLHFYNSKGEKTTIVNPP